MEFYYASPLNASYLNQLQVVSFNSLGKEIQLLIWLASLCNFSAEDAQQVCKMYTSKKRLNLNDQPINPQTPLAQAV